MNILKSMVAAALVILVIALTGIYFLPNNFTISHSIEIDKPVGVVYGEVADYGKWAAWNPWKEQEPGAKFTITDAAGAVGHKYGWDGKLIGKGSMTISATVPNESISHDIEFTNPIKAKAVGMLVFEPNGDKTRVTWITNGGLPYPFGRLWGLTVDNMIGDAQQKGLDNLRKVCEAIPAPVVVMDDSSGATSTAKAMH